MNVLVTGGTGYLGGAIVRALAARGHAPVVFARSASRSGLPGRLVDGDVRDPAAVMAAARGCDAICHTAALVKVWCPRREDFDEINIGGLRNVLAAARALGTPRVVYTSSFLALPPSDRHAELAANDYQRTKLLARREALGAIDEGAPLICIYPGVVYGPGARTEGNLVGRLVADHLARRLPGLIGPEKRWSYAFVDDVAEGHVAALERGRIGGEYRLGGENAPQVRVFEIVRELTGRPLPRRIPFPIARALAIAEEARTAVTRRPPLLTRGVVSIFEREWELDSRAAADALGYRVRPLVEGVTRVVEDLRSA